MERPPQKKPSRPLPKLELKSRGGPWLNATLRERLPEQFTYRPDFGPEKIAFRRIKFEKPSVWATKHRILKMSSIMGPWKHVFTPYLETLMDAARFPSVDTCIICKSPQTGGSEACLNLLGHAIDHYPGPALVVYPDAPTAKEVSRDRLLPMLQDSPRLRQYLTGDLGDESSIRINLKHMPIYLGWSGSVSRLGSKPIRTLILDELDKYQNVAREADSQVLAEKRTITWEGRRRLIMKISTPTTETGPIWVAYTEEANARFNWMAVCPYCGKAQLMDFDRIKWPSDIRDPETVLKDKLAWYECEHCGEHWDDEDRNKAVRNGQWVERDSGLELFAHLEQERPLKIAFHIPAWISYFVSLSAIAHAFLRYNKSQRLADLKDFLNQFKAEPWRETLIERKEDQILALCDDRPRGIVPGPVDGVPRVAALVAGIDTQAHDFRYVIRAFAFGAEEESWLIQCGQAPTFAALDDIMWRSSYHDPDGREYRVRLAVIDAMGYPGKTKAVYAWCAQHRNTAIPYQGKQRLSNPIATSYLDYFPGNDGKKLKIPGGITLWRCDTTFFKNELAEKLGVASDDPGAFHLHSNTVRRSIGIDSESNLAAYASEMCAEVYNTEKLVWENPKNKPNHYWDCEVMASVAAWGMQIRHWRRPEAQTKTTPARPKPTPRPTDRTHISPGDILARLRDRRH